VTVPATRPSGTSASPDVDRACVDESLDGLDVGPRALTPEPDGVELADRDVAPHGVDRDSTHVNSVDRGKEQASDVDSNKNLMVEATRHGRFHPEGRQTTASERVGSPPYHFTCQTSSRRPPTQVPRFPRHRGQYCGAASAPASKTRNA